jgi:hypothetical protein
MNETNLVLLYAGRPVGIYPNTVEGKATAASVGEALTSGMPAEHVKQTIEIVPVPMAPFVEQVASGLLPFAVTALPGWLQVFPARWPFERQDQPNMATVVVWADTPGAALKQAAPQVVA